MKQLTRKLFLSICTLAICAVTLVSTTFAWYTTNKEVNVNGITGTATTEGAASIYVSQNATDWSQTITLSTSHVTQMVPVQLVEKVNEESVTYEYQYLDGTAVDEADGALLTFTLYFKTAKTTADVDLFISDVVLKNSKDTLDQFDNLLYNTDKTGGLDNQKSKYAVDIVKSLAMTTMSSSVARESAAEDAKTTDVTAYNNFLDFQNLLDGWKNSHSTNEPLADINVSSANAVAYYNSVMKPTTDIDPSKVSGLVMNDTNKFKQISVDTTSRTKVATLPENGYYVQVDFTVYINGWDSYCYDACKAQSFKLDLKFATNSSN